MAEGDDKKDEEKELTAGEKFWASFDIVEWAIIGIFFFIIALKAQSFFSGGSASKFTSWLSVRPNFQADIDSFRVGFSQAVQSITAFSTGFSILLAAVIGYIIFRQHEVDKEWHHALYPDEQPHQKASEAAQAASPAGIPGVPANLPTGMPHGASGGIPVVTVSRQLNPRWKKVLEHIGSDNPSDWRLAILEADIILEETLDRAGYAGDTLGDKLKHAEKRPFASVNAAWEAHKVRNAIAHQGQGFELNQREAQNAIALFEAVFREFGTV